MSGSSKRPVYASINEATAVDFDVAGTAHDNARAFLEARPTTIFYRSGGIYGHYVNGRWRRLMLWDIADEVRESDWMGVLDADALASVLACIGYLAPYSARGRRR
jgi:hypothetical protein